MSKNRKNRAQGSVTATGTICTVDLDGFKDLSHAVGGTFVGTVQVQVSNDGTTWAPLVASITAPAAAIVQGCGFKLARLQCTAYTSGTIVGFLAASE